MDLAALEPLVTQYGYPAVYAGAFLEGGMTVIAGGVAAHQGLLSLPWVIFAAFAGTACGDQLYFFIGRRYGQRVLDRRPGWKRQAEKAFRLLDRYQTLYIVSCRFLYGLHKVSPFVIGMTKIGPVKYAILNLVSAVVWAGVFGGAGYAFGQEMDTVMTGVKHVTVVLIVAAGLIGLATAAHYLARGGRSGKGTE